MGLLRPVRETTSPTPIRYRIVLVCGGSHNTGEGLVVLVVCCCDAMRGSTGWQDWRSVAVIYADLYLGRERGEQAKPFATLTTSCATSMICTFGSFNGTVGLM